MKSNTKLFVVLAVMLLLSQLTAWGADWEEAAQDFLPYTPEAVGEGIASEPGTNPFALDDQGKVHMVFAGTPKDGNGDPLGPEGVYWSKYDPDDWTLSQTWSIAALDDDMIAEAPEYGYCNGVSIVMDADGVLHAVWREWEYVDYEHHIRFVHSMYTSGAWSTPDIIEHTATTQHAGDIANLFEISAVADPDGGIDVVYTGRTWSEYYFNECVWHKHWDPISGWGSADLLCVEDNYFEDPAQAYVYYPQALVGQDGSKIALWWWMDADPENTVSYLHGAVYSSGWTSLPGFASAIPDSPGCYAAIDLDGKLHVVVFDSQGLHHRIFDETWENEDLVPPDDCSFYPTASARATMTVDRRGDLLLAVTMWDESYHRDLALRKYYYASESWSDWMIFDEEEWQGGVLGVQPSIITAPSVESEESILGGLDIHMVGINIGDPCRPLYWRFTILPHGWNYMSVPFEPEDPAPGTVFSALSEVNLLDNRLYKWVNPLMGTIAYDEGDPDAFGGIHLPHVSGTHQGGYQVINQLGSSEGSIIVPFHGVANDDETYDISIPSAGAALIGCPYPEPVHWEDVTVTYDGDTYPMIDACFPYGAGWLSSTTTWWDAEGQGSRTMGLPDDGADSEYLFPWHAYWVTTRVSNVTLHIPRP